MNAMRTEPRLRAIHASVWRMLAEGCDDPAHPARTGVLATVRARKPTLRTLVLRQVDSRQRLLAGCTDVRSMKVSDIRANPAVEWLFYDPASHVQLRLSGRAVLHQADAVARRWWKLIPAAKRAHYGTLAAPGKPIAHPDAAWPPGAAGTSDAAVAHFAVVRCTVTGIDWLKLGPALHERARFAWTRGGWRGCWVAP